MPAYLIGTVKKRDEAMFQEYLAAALPSFAGHELRILALCDDPTVLEGRDVPDRVVLVEFPDREAAERWYRSDAYQANALPLRHAAAETPFMVVVETP